MTPESSIRNNLYIHFGVLLDKPNEILGEIFSCLWQGFGQIIEQEKNWMATVNSFRYLAFWSFVVTTM